MPVVSIENPQVQGVGRWCLRVLGFLLLISTFYVFVPYFWLPESRERMEIKEQEIGEVVKKIRRQDEERQWLCRLARAVNEAHENCELVSRDAHPSGVFRLGFKQARAAFEENPLVHSLTYGELPHLLDLVVFLEAYASSVRLDEDQADALLTGRGYSYEDLRYVLGFMHWYLSCAFDHWNSREGVNPLKARALLHSEHERHYQQEDLNLFRNKDFGTFLGELD